MTKQVLAVIGFLAGVVLGTLVFTGGPRDAYWLSFAVTVAVCSALIWRFKR